MKEEVWWVIITITMIVSLILIVFIDSWLNGFKTQRQICEENGGVYIEDLSSHNQHKCIYNLKGNDKE